MNFRHEWKFDLPWHMVDLRDWFYMVNSGFIFGKHYLHVRIMGLRSLWVIPSLSSGFPEPEYLPPIQSDSEGPDFLCRIGWHHWTNWKLTLEILFISIQERACKRCGFTERRTI